MNLTPETLAALAGGLLLVSLGLTLWLRRRRRQGAEAARAKGRAQVLAVLENIPLSVVFQNVSINFNGRLGEIDLLLIRDNGIFAVETETLSGTVQVSNAPEWTVQGHGGLGRRTVRNPIARVMRNIRTLKESMEAQTFPIRPLIEVVVCLTDESARIKIADAQRIPVLPLSELPACILARPEMTPKNAHEAAKLRSFLLDNGVESVETGKAMDREPQPA